jgi:nitroimidazol reductase NimA-like FMN-containing flavoprotein (pyridoxamine 5'-phosphate oxidase superfamily)
MDNITPTEDTTLRRLPRRGSFDKATINAILDEALVCHVGFVANGRPFVIPTSYVRVDDQLLIHGSAISRMQLSLRDGIQACVTVTLIDGLVLARSAFHHSINYRSVVILGTMTPVEDEHQKMAALRAFTEHVVPGRWKDVREPTKQELKGTSVLSMVLSEASAKIRTGPPIDDEEDYAVPVWAGQLPLRLAPGTPIADREMKLPVPEYVANYRRPRSAHSEG